MIFLIICETEIRPEMEMGMEMEMEMEKGWKHTLPALFLELNYAHSGNIFTSRLILCLPYLLVEPIRSLFLK